MEDENTMDLTTFKKKFDEVIKENNKLYDIKKRYVEHAEKIKNIAIELATLAKEIDPVTNMWTPRSSKKKYIDEFHEHMKAGGQVTRHLIETKYPDLNSTELNYILSEYRDIY